MISTAAKCTVCRGRLADLCAPESTFDKSSGESFVCSVCGYVYSDPNFSFEELPDNWVCPVCKMPKKAFVRRN
mgnify:CR=1 FL=1